MTPPAWSRVITLSPSAARPARPVHPAGPVHRAEGLGMVVMLMMKIHDILQNSHSSSAFFTKHLLPLSPWPLSAGGKKLS